MSGALAMRSNTSEILYKNGTTFVASNSGDSFTKVADTISVSEGGNSGLDKLGSDKLSHVQYSDVRFTPNALEFFDAFQGKQYCEKLVIQNVGRNPVIIRIGEPTSFIFQLKKPSRRNIFLAAGASITRTITYTYHNNDLVQKSRIPIYINGRRIDYPIMVKKAKPELEVDPPKIDFGTINLGSEVKTLILTISNLGGTRSKFEIDMGKNDLDLVVNPMRGTVKAKQSVQVSVEILGMKQGDFYREIWIKTNETPIRVPVLVEVVRPRLLVVFPNGTEEFSAIDFPPTFDGTQRAVPFILKNCGGETALFITSVEINGEHQFINEARKTHEIFKFFSLTAEEGRLESHEARVLTALFRPVQVKKTKGWHHQEKAERKPQSEYIVFFTMSRVHCIERREIEKAYAPFYQMENPKSPMSVRIKKDASRFEAVSEHITREFINQNNFKESEFKLCLRGKSVRPEIVVQPSKIHFGRMILGETKQRVLTVTNKSIIRVKCAFEKKMNVDVLPKELWIGPEKIHEFPVRVTPTCPGTFNHVIKIQIFGESDVVYATDEPIKAVAQYSFIISFTGITPRKMPSPKIGLGITPLITDEVGINKELVTFQHSKQVPYAAKLLSLKEEFKPDWMKMNPLDARNAIMALPNDRPRGFQTWPKDQICRTIFKGWLRYAPPKDPLYTLPSEEQLLKDQHEAVWANYLLVLREIRKEYNEKAEMCRDIRIPNCHYKFKKQLCSTEEHYQSPQTMVKKAACYNLQKCLVPLSPMYLSCVIVEPKMINFGMVAVNHSVGAELTIKNQNVFPIAIKFVPRNSSVMVNESAITVHPNSEKTIKVFFQLNILGRYYGFLNYVINGSHEFKITISAFVMSRTVVIERKNLLFCNYPPEQAFQPRTMFLPLENWLQAPIRYKFEFSSDSPYFAILEEGEIPPRSKMHSEIVFGAHPKKPLSAEMKITSESGNKELMKISQIYKKLSVGFLTNRIDLKDIPLNLKTKATPVVENECFHDVTFEVINGTPIPGVTVEPRSGLIKARSFFPLNVQIQIPVAMKFTFEIHMIIQTSNSISVKISGNVVLPVIRITPPAINMRKICAQSFDTVMICIENEGTTPSEIDIDFRACPEYSVLDDKSHLYLRPKQSTSVVIKFEPNDVARYIFYLPIIINKILGPPMMQESETEKVSFFLADLSRMYDVYGDVYDSEKLEEKVPLAVLSCTVASSLISVNPTVIDFNSNIKGDLVTCTPNDPYTSKIRYKESGLCFLKKTLTITNENVKTVTFCIRNDDLGKENDSPFNMIPVDRENVEFRLKSMKVTLAPGQQMEFVATFSPKRPGKYNVEIPIYVRGYNNGVVYCYITLKGKVKEPNLIPEAQEIHFSPVPLNVSTELKFTITAENYRKPDVISCLICDAKDSESAASHSLRTSWVKPPEVTDLKDPQKFSIHIAFKSETPVAIRCYLVFVDSERNHCSVLLTAIADNSSLTTHSFLYSKMQRYKFVRPNCTRLVWKADEHPVLLYPFDKKYLNDLYKKEKSEKKSEDNCLEASNLASNINCTKAIDRGPSLVVQGSATRSNVGLVTWNKSDESTTGLPFNAPPFTSVISLGNRVKSSQSRGHEVVDNSYPNYPMKDGTYKKYCDSTLQYVERWIYEVVMRCHQYFMIPWSFHISKKHFKAGKGDVRTEKDVVDFLAEVFGEHSIRRCHNVENVESPFRWANRLYRFYADLLRMLESHGCFLPHIRPEFLLPYDEYSSFVQTIKIVEFIKPINLDRGHTSEGFTFNILNVKKRSEVEESAVPKTTSGLSGKDWSSTKSGFEAFSSHLEMGNSLEKQENSEMVDNIESRSRQREVGASFPYDEFQHKHEVLDEVTFSQRSTQAWLDIIIQIFRHEVLKKIIYKSTIPPIRVIEPGDKLPIQTLEVMKVLFYGEGKGPMLQSDTNSLYNIQERTLLLWLNHHLNVQRNLMWRNSIIPKDKIINNFHKDLADSLALISVTASYCPFVVPEYFRDCFSKPDTPVKLYHNAARLVQAWRELSIGLTVETTDIVRPNNVFLLMLVAQLYEVLPAMHPQYLLSFEAPLSSQQTRKISVQCEGRLFYQAKILGEDSKYFKLGNESLMELRAGKIRELKVTFYARKIKKVKATLLFSGCEESPHFGKTLAIFLEGQLSELTESEKLSFSAPLYKVICTEIPIKPLYSDAETYEIWYSTTKPTLSESSELIHSKPWSKLRFRKLCRRLYLNQNEVTLEHGQKSLSLSVTVACFTHKERLFWLLFRSKTRDFIVRVKIKCKVEKVPQQVLKCWFPESRVECLCAQTDKGPRTNWADMKSCPLLTVIRLPSRNDSLWKALQMMFLKSVLPQEKTFWEEYFEKDIGLCIIQWLLSSDEEEEVVDEFLPLLQTRIVYRLSVNDLKKTIRLPPHIEIKDVRENLEVVIPIHIDKGSPDEVLIQMVSESKMEVRLFKVQNEGEEEKKSEVTIDTNEIYRPSSPPTAMPCRRRNSKSFARLY